MRSMGTLIDANHALSKDLPLAYLGRRHWLEAGNLLIEAATTGDDADVELATEKLLYAIEHEGWMERPVLIPEARPGDGDSAFDVYVPKRKARVENFPAKLEPFFGPRMRLLERNVVDSKVPQEGAYFASAR
jgi:hypothetical protein